MKKYTVLILVTLIIFLSCKNIQKVKSTKLVPLIKISEKILCNTQTYNVYSAICSDRIVLYSDSKGVYVLQPSDNSFKKIVSKGPGPDEMLIIKGLTLYNDNVYTFSELPARHILKINLKENLKVERIDINRNHPLAIDDLDFYRDRLIIGNVYAVDGLFEKFEIDNQKKASSFCKATKINLMYKFNISHVSFEVDEDEGKLYFVESIRPVINIVNLNDKSLIGHIRLLHPLYSGIKGDYQGNKFSDKKHKDWMAKHSFIKNIIKRGKYILIQYRWGYETIYFYEIINLENHEQRYMIGNTSEFIYSISPIKNGNFLFSSVEISDKKDAKWSTSEYRISVEK